MTPIGFLCHSRESGSPAAFHQTGFPLEFTPAKAEAGMTRRSQCVFKRILIYDRSQDGKSKT